MTQFTTAMDAALAGASFTVFGAVEITLPEHTIRLVDGSGAVTFGGRTFTGLDATYGSLSEIDVISDGADGEAPSVTIGLIPASDAAASSLAAANMQGSPVAVYLGLVDPAAGTVIADPLLIFSGMLDVPKLTASEGGRLLEYEVSSAFEAFFELDEGTRLADTFHQSIWPGELGFAFVTGVDEQIYWGEVAPTESITKAPRTGFRGPPASTPASFGFPGR